MLGVIGVRLREDQLAGQLGRGNSGYHRPVPVHFTTLSPSPGDQEADEKAASAMTTANSTQPQAFEFEVLFVGVVVVVVLDVVVVGRARVVVVAGRVVVVGAVVGGTVVVVVGASVVVVTGAVVVVVSRAAALPERAPIMSGTAVMATRDAATRRENIGCMHAAYGQGRAADRDLGRGLRSGIPRAHRVNRRPGHRPALSLRSSADID